MDTDEINVHAWELADVSGFHLGIGGTSLNQKVGSSSHYLYGP